MLQVVITIILSVLIFYMHLMIGDSSSSAMVAVQLVICTSIITYKIDQLRKEIKKDEDPEKSGKTEE